jgi:hypothetical protein
MSKMMRVPGQIFFTLESHPQALCEDLSGFGLRLVARFES